MATATLQCTEAKRWNYQDAMWYPFNGSFNGYTGLGMIGYIPQISGYVPGIQQYAFGAVPAGATITSAILHIKTARYNGTSSPTIRLRISTSPDAYTTSAPSGYQETIVTVSSTLTDRTVDITAQMQAYANAGSNVYLYLYEPSDSGGGAATECIQRIAADNPTIVVTYTTGDTAGRYNGTTFENCELYRYNGTTFVQCDIFRYDGTQFVECSTT